MNPQMMIAITGKNMSKPAFDSVVSDANRAAGAVDKNGNRMAGAMGNAAFQTANLASQYNDVIVGIQGGQPAWTIGIQQGMQMAQVYGPLGVAGSLDATKKALLSLLSPMTFISVLGVAAGAALVQWLLSARTDAETATEAFERHRKTLSGIVDGYDAAQSAVNNYLDVVSRLPRSIAADNLVREFATIGAEIDAFRERAAFVGTVFDGFGTTAEQELTALSARFADGSISAEEFYTGLQDVRGNLNGLETALSGISVAKLIDEMEQGALKSIQFGNGIANLVAQSHALAGIAQDSELSSFFQKNSVEGALDALKSMTPELRTQQQIIQDTYSKAMSNPALTDAGRSQLSAARDDALAAVATADARKEAAKAANKQASAYKDVVEQLQFEAELIGKSAREQDVMNNIRAAGVDATSEQGRAIRELTEQIYDQNKALDAAEAAAKNANKALDSFTGGAKSELLGVVTSLAKGWDAAGEAANRALENMTSKALELASSGLIDMLFGNLFGGGKAASSITGSSGGYFPGLTGPSLPSFDGGGSTGSGARSGGLDGKGGFMAMLHPQEHVDDLTVSRNSGGGGGVSVVRLELGADLEGRILQQSAQQSVQIVSASASHIAEQGANGAGAKLRNGDFDTAMAGRYRVAPAAKVR